MELDDVNDTVDDSRGSTTFVSVRLILDLTIFYT